MGRFIWHEWSRYVAISASVYLVWAAIWGIFYRKFFWDFIDHGYDTSGPVPLPIPNPRYKAIISIIVTIPLIQILALIMALGTLAVEYPIPPLKSSMFHRNFTFKCIWLVFQAVLAALFYQGTNAFIWSTIAAFGYLRAEMRGEIMEDPNKARGGRGRA
ncbi:hypothetical protein DL93DRAFT_306740 [Clavulina sp. PMI_390]|nr:hypothetical protein DL93DRAFT_306740 [Clavulina sp. PMI_390]